MEGAPLHCSRRPRTRHGPWGPLIHHGCPSPRIYHGRLNSLPQFLKPNVLSLPLVSPFPLGPSLGQGSLRRPGGRLSRLCRPGGRLSRLLRPGGRLSRLLRPGGRLSRLFRPGGRLSRLFRPGGRLSRLLRPGGRLSRLLRPGGRLSRLLRPGGRLSRLLRPGGCLICQSHPTPPPTCQSHPTPPPTCQSHPTPPPTCQSHPTPPPTCQSHPTPPPTCQSHPTPPPTCQSHLTSQRSTQYPFRSLLSRPPCPGGLLYHWPHMDLALHSLPRFHLRSTAFLDCAVCVTRLEAALWGGALSWIWLPLTTTAHHPWTTSPIMHCTHTFPSTITPITQLSQLTHQPWLPHHTCTSFTHSHKSSTQTLTQCEVLFPPGYISERFSQFVFPCTTWTVDLLSWSFAACLSDLACFMVILSVCRLPWPIALPLISTLPFLRCPRYLCLIFACLTLYNKAASGSTLASDLSFVTARYVCTYEGFVFVTEATAVQQNDSDRTKNTNNKKKN